MAKMTGMVTSLPWPLSPEKLDWGESEVHVWSASLDMVPEKQSQLEQILSEEERTRAARFHFQSDRNHYIVGRGLLRRILGRYLATDPIQLRFSGNAFGKPELPATQGFSDIQFNLSHSRGLVLYGITRYRKIGIDLEFIRPDFATTDIARRFFSPREVSMLRQVPPGLQSEAFFNCWTRKEAFIKARGEGLSIPLDSFDVTLVPGDAPTLLRSDHDSEASGRWTIRELHPASGYAAALAVEGKSFELKCWTCSL